MKLHGIGEKIDDEKIIEFEEKINGKLSNEYKIFLMENNGGYLDDYLVTPKFIEVIPSNSERYYQSTSPDKFYSLEELLEEYEDNLDDQVLPDNYISIAYDTGGNQIVMYVADGEQNGEIYFANHELYDPLTGFWLMTKLSNTFNEFVQSLHPFEE